MKEVKRRLTKQKKAIYEILKESGDHMTADEVYAKVRRKLENISLATVYRNLEGMTEVGLFDEVYVAGYPKWFELKKYTTHGHLFCRNCNELHDVVECSFCRTWKKIDKEMSFKGEEFKFLIIGLCAKCEKKENANKR